MAVESPSQPIPAPDLHNNQNGTNNLDVMRCREKFSLLREAFFVEQESHDYLSLHRVTAHFIRPFLYAGSAAKVELDCVLRNLGAEFLLDLLPEVKDTPIYYPTGDKAWFDEFPSLESREAMDNRFCAFHLITIMADTVPALARSLANDRAFQIGGFSITKSGTLA